MSFVGYIIINPGMDNSFQFDLIENEIAEIGRGEAEPGQLRLVLDELEVSGYHAEIKYSNYGWSIRDVGSTNGTKLNGNWLTPGHEHLLKNDDVIQIASYKLVMKLKDDGKKSLKKETAVDGNAKTKFQVKRMNASILVGDFRAFTTLLEDYSATPDIVMQATQKIFKDMNEIIFSEHGQVEKIAGDAIMAYWHSEDENVDTSSTCAYNGCLSALKLRQLITTLSKDSNYWPFENHKLHLDIAIASGPVASGVLGEVRANPHLLGDTANLAFRLEKLIDQDRPGDIILDGSTYELIKGKFTTDSLGEVVVKGRQKPVSLYRLIS